MIDEDKERKARVEAYDDDRRNGRKLGPDPASESACTIGEVVANNSSGSAAPVREEMKPIIRWL